IDQASIVNFVKNDFPENRLTLITHSVGGQVLGFNSHYHLLDNIVTVASQSGYWKHFEGFNKSKMWLFWYGMVPTLTALYGYVPAKKLGLFENLPKNLVYEWAKWGKHKNYIMGHHTHNDTYFNKIETPILVLSFPRDIYAPKRNVEWLASQFMN